MFCLDYICAPRVCLATEVKRGCQTLSNWRQRVLRHLVGAGTPPTHKVGVPMLSGLCLLPIPSVCLMMGSCVAQAGLWLTAQLRMMLIFGSSCSASAVLRITDSHHAQTLQGKEQNLGYMHAGKHHCPSHIPGHLSVLSTLF